MQVLSTKRLNGYDDLNFHVKVNLSDVDNSHIETVCTAGYVVKVMNTIDSEMNKQHVGEML